MNNKIKEHCIRQGISQDVGINIVTSAEIKDMLIFDEPFRSSSFVIIAMRKGTLSFTNHFVEVNLTSNDVYILTSGTLFELKEMSADTDFISMGFSRSFLKEQGVFINGAEIVPMLHANLVQKFSLTDDEFTDLTNSLICLKRRVGLPPTTAHLKDVIKHGFLAAFYDLLTMYSRYSVYTPVKMNRQEELTAAFLNLLGNHFKQEKKVQYYAQQLFVGARHLSFVVKQVTGRTAGEIIHEMVVNEAKMLLSSHLMNVAQVADELRFSDQSFFGKYFKKHAGVSPSAYKANATVAIRAPF